MKNYKFTVMMLVVILFLVSCKELITDEIISTNQLISIENTQLLYQKMSKNGDFKKGETYFGMPDWDAAKTIKNETGQTFIQIPFYQKSSKILNKMLEGRLGIKYMSNINQNVNYLIATQNESNTNFTVIQKINNIMESSNDYFYFDFKTLQFQGGYKYKNGNVDKYLIKSISSKNSRIGGCTTKYMRLCLYLFTITTGGGGGYEAITMSSVPDSQDCPQGYTNTIPTPGEQGMDLIETLTLFSSTQYIESVCVDDPILPIPTDPHVDPANPANCRNTYNPTNINPFEVFYDKCAALNYLSSHPNAVGYITTNGKVYFTSGLLDLSIYCLDQKAYIGTSRENMEEVLGVISAEFGMTVGNQGYPGEGPELQYASRNTTFRHIFVSAGKIVEYNGTGWFNEQSYNNLNDVCWYL